MPLSLDELDLQESDFALTDYGINPRWSTGSLFFKKSVYDLLIKLKEIVYKYKINEEFALVRITKKDEKLRNRIKKLNITYNFSTSNRQIRSCYAIADKPIKVLHFHPFDHTPKEWGKDNIDICLYGKNKVSKPLMPERVVNLFHTYGIN